MDDIIKKIERLTLAHDKIPLEIIEKKRIKLGLRNPDGSGVVAGVTKKGRVKGYSKTGNKLVPQEGKLYYCGYDVEKIVDGNNKRNSFAFDEVVYILLTGELPGEKDLKEFSKAMAKRRALSKSERSVIMEEVPNENQMYGLHSVISHLGRCDPNPDSIDINDVSRQSLNLIAKFPIIVAYNYNVMRYRKGADLKMLVPKPDLSTAENFLYLINGKIPDKYEAHIFDTALILHAEHGGGNNSTFTVRTVSSSGANTYMAIAAGIASLSGRFHGGANKSVNIMMKDIKKNVLNWKNEKAIESYFTKIMSKEVGDKSGKIYGFGHAVYTVSDPRAIILKEYAIEYSKRKKVYNEFKLYETIDKIASDILSTKYKKPICANVDFYSGFIYNLMGLTSELFTPIFAMARVAGWCAHRLEQIVQGKIMRPAYISVNEKELKYKTLDNR